MQQVLVTGASGFIGGHLVEALCHSGLDVTCLVRSTSNVDRLKHLGCQFVQGDLQNTEQLKSAIDRAGPDCVFHLAGLTKALRSQTLFEVNQRGTRNLVDVLSQLSNPPVTLVVSTLAAAGPSHTRPLVETDTPRPVSHYGKSKHAAECEAARFCDRVPITIMRPPIVFGPHDKDSFELFKPISRVGLHVVPTWRSVTVSWIHVSDLCSAMLAAGERGRRMHPGSPSDGVYFTTSDEVVRYTELGHRVGEALGRRTVRSIPIPGPLLWGMAALYELSARVRRKQGIFNFDKAREATAGSWTCSGEKLSRETGFRSQIPLTEALAMSAAWYRESGWL